MVLSSQYLSEIVSHVRFASRATSSERRRTSRMDIQYPVEVTRLSSREGGTFTVLSRDICQEGLGLFSAKPMLKGEQFRIRLPRDEKHHIDLVGVVVFHRVIADDMFSIGLNFVRVDDGARAPAGPPSVDDTVRRISNSVLD